MKRRTKVAIVCCAVALIASIEAISWLGRRDFEKRLLESLDIAAGTLRLGESITVSVENTLGADICVICCGYTDGNYIYSHVGEVRINKRLAKRIAKKVPAYDGDYLLLVKGKRVAYVGSLGRYAAPAIHVPGSKGLVGKGILASKVGKQIGLALKRVSDEAPLLIESIE
jgi:hypothetical protein